MTRMIPIANGQGNCLRLAVALSPGFSSSGSVGGSFGLVAMVVTCCRPSTVGLGSADPLLTLALVWDGPERRCDARIGKST